MSGQAVKGGPYQSRLEALQTARNYMEDQLKKGNMGPVLHDVVDWETPRHAGKEWHGFTLLPIPLFSKAWFSVEGLKTHFQEFKETWHHIWGDFFPSEETKQAGRQRVVDVLTKGQLPTVPTE